MEGAGFGVFGGKMEGCVGIKESVLGLGIDTVREGTANLPSDSGEGEGGGGYLCSSFFFYWRYCGQKDSRHSI